MVGFVFDIADAAVYAFVDHDYGMAALSLTSVVLDCAPVAVSALLAGKAVTNSADLLKAGNRVANLTQSARVADMTSEMANAYKGLDRINDAGSAMKSVTKYTVDNLDTLAKKGAKEVYGEVTTGAYKAGREALQESMEETFEAAWKGSKNVTPSDFAGGACFVAGTKIKTIDGYQNIEDIEEGDLVSAWNEETGETGYKEVVTLFRKEVTELIHVQIGDNTIITTPTHPFWVEGYGFKAAGELQAGDLVQTAEGDLLTVTGIEKEYLDNPIIVYNFEVADWHTYYVSEDEVLVHNMCMVDVKTGYGKSSGKATAFSDLPWYEQPRNTKGTGRARNNIGPNKDATGKHVVYKTDPQTGKVTNYKVYDVNPKNPSGFDEVLGYDGIGKPHTNKITNEDLLPHMHDPKAPGGVRRPNLDEIPD